MKYKIYFLLSLVSIFFLGCENPSGNIPLDNIENISWQASKFRTSSTTQSDMISNNWVYIFSNGMGIFTDSGVVSGDGFTYILINNEITISGASEENLPDGLYYYWIENDTLFIHSEYPVPTDDVPTVEFIKI